LKKKNSVVDSNNKVVKLRFEDNNLARNLFGVHDQNLRSLEKKLDITINVRGTDVSLAGGCSDVEIAGKLLNEFYQLLKKGYPVFGSDIEQAVKILSKDHEASLHDIFSHSIFIPAKGHVIIPKNYHQKQYMDAIRQSDLVFGIGPAGTGKTYLAVAMAVMALSKKQVERIILVRPAVEAGEKIGFLPGDLLEKINPYLRPLYDALYDMMDFEKTVQLRESGVIEVAPLAFMRGRTLSSSFVILDEAQNSTREQMKMFLTRLGFGSKVVVTGDITQIDLPEGKMSGLVEAEGILKGIQGISFQYFDAGDVVRHPLVSDIIDAYQK